MDPVIEHSKLEATGAPHEAVRLPANERISYLHIVATIAAADVKLERSETTALRSLCERLEIPPEQRDAVFRTAARPATLLQSVHALKTSELRFTLLTDCLLLAHADGDYSRDERAHIERIATALGVSPDQLDAIEEAVLAARSASECTNEAASNSGTLLATRLASVGVPVSALALTSGLSLQTAGVSSGLAALGMGLGIASGFGVALGVGVGTYLGVRWIAERL